MGASWGDYDNDGRDDLYVSNMYSEAGRRITARLPGLDKTFAESAAGNYLYHRETDGRFRQVAGLTPPAMTVMKRAGPGADASLTSIMTLSRFVRSERILHRAQGTRLRSRPRKQSLANHGPRRCQCLAPEFSVLTGVETNPGSGPLGPPNRCPPGRHGTSGRPGRGPLPAWRGTQRFFANRGGRAFVDVSGISGLDDPADSRGFGVIDYDRDGWQDVALVNANQPLFNLFHNEMPAAGFKSGMIALRFVGGSRTPNPVQQYACRDGFGARVTMDLDDTQITREHRCGEGWSVQNSATMILGIGTHAKAKSVVVRWPSGKTSQIDAVPEGTLLTVYENPAEGPTGQAFVSKPYRNATRPTVPSTTPPTTAAVFPVRPLDRAAKPARLRVYSSFATSCAPCTADVPLLLRLIEVLRPEGIDIAAVTVDPADDDSKLASFARQWKPKSRLVNLPTDKRQEIAAAFAKVLGTSTGATSTVITDDAGHVLAAQPGIPNLSTLRKLIPSIAK
jgi:thiol-disulfide isomerase/thioredoxin